MGNPILQEMVHLIVGIIFCSFNYLNWHIGKEGQVEPKTGTRGAGGGCEITRSKHVLFCFFLCFAEKGDLKDANAQSSYPAARLFLV